MPFGSRGVVSSSRGVVGRSSSRSTSSRGRPPGGRPSTKIAKPYVTGGGPRKPVKKTAVKSVPKTAYKKPKKSTKSAPKSAYKKAPASAVKSRPQSAIKSRSKGAIKSVPKSAIKSRKGTKKARKDAIKSAKAARKSKKLAAKAARKTGRSTITRTTQGRASLADMMASRGMAGSGGGVQRLEQPIKGKGAGHARRSMRGSSSRGTYGYAGGAVSEGGEERPVPQREVLAGEGYVPSYRSRFEPSIRGFMEGKNRGFGMDWNLSGGRPEGNPRGPAGVYRRGNAGAPVGLGFRY